MKLITVLALSALTSFSYADQWKTVTEDVSWGIERYDAEVSYPTIFEGSWVSAVSEMNKNIRASILANGCLGPGDDESDIWGDRSYTSEDTAIITGFNRNYVGLRVAYYSDCGGAHPNYGEYFLAFDSHTGQRIDMSEEVPANNYDHPQKDALALRLATLLYNSGFEGEYANECGDFYGEDATREDIIKDIANTEYPTIKGLARNKKVIIGNSMPHVVKVCERNIRVNYRDVKEFIKPDSVLHQYLR